MIDKDPSSFPAITYTWVACWGAISGGLAYLQKLKQNKKFDLRSFSIESALAAFVAILVFWGCEAGGANKLVEAITIGIAAHHSTRAIMILRNKVLGDEPK